MCFAHTILCLYIYIYIYASNIYNIKIFVAHILKELVQTHAIGFYAPDFLLRSHTCVMLHYPFFSCIRTHAGCCTRTSSLALAHMRDVTYVLKSFLALAHMQRFYTTRSSLALAHMCDVTLRDLLLHLHTCRMLRQQIFSDTCTQAGCYARRVPANICKYSFQTAHMQDVTASSSSLELAHMQGATLADPVLHLHTCRMLRYQIFSCTCTHV